MAKFKFKTNGNKRKLRIFRLSNLSYEKEKMLGPRIEMSGNSEFSLDGCLGIIEYNDVYVRIKVSGGEVTVLGVSLDIPVFDGPAITVTGQIKTVEFGLR